MVRCTFLGKVQKWRRSVLNGKCFVSDIIKEGVCVCVLGVGGSWPPVLAGEGRGQGEQLFPKAHSLHGWCLLKGKVFLQLRETS